VKNELKLWNELPETTICEASSCARHLVVAGALEANASRSPATTAAPAVAVALTIPM